MSRSDGTDSVQLEHWVHWSLLAGLILSGMLLAVGLVLALVGGQPRPEGPPSSLTATLRAAISGQGVDLIDLGLLVLMTTPLLRVAVLAVGWGLRGSWRFALVALVVLVLLGISLALGLG